MVANAESSAQPEPINARASRPGSAPLAHIHRATADSMPWHSTHHRDNRLSHTRHLLAEHIVRRITTGRTGTATEHQTHPNARARTNWRSRMLVHHQQCPARRNGILVRAGSAADYAGNVAGGRAPAATIPATPTTAPGATTALPPTHTTTDRVKRSSDTTDHSAIRRSISPDPTQPVSIVQSIPRTAWQWSC